MSAERIHIMLENLIIRYSDNEYMSSRLVNYIEYLLPTALENERENYIIREERKKQLIQDKDEFVLRFLHRNNYFYSPQTDLFMVYDGTHFVSYSEGKIHHQILSTIANEEKLMSWKYKIKINIMKQIKERSPLTAIPESATIQFVINALVPAVFPTRNHVKYFLTVIGDQLKGGGGGGGGGVNEEILNNLIYIISPAAKDIINEISSQCRTLFGYINFLINIKFKYYEHNYANCRLLQVSDLKQKSIAIPDKLVKFMVDFLSVAAHYHMRYGSADNFLKKCAESRLVDHALLLNRNTPETIVSNFLELTIYPCSGSKIGPKNMIFIWKKYLEERNLPNIIFHSSVITMIKTKIPYDESCELFNDVTSTQLPIVANFLKFWETTISEDDTEPELEIDEIAILFKGWNGGNISGGGGIGKSSIQHTSSVNDKMIIDLIRHFYPDTIIEDDKYILHVKCCLWDKRIEIMNSLHLFRFECSVNNVFSTKTLYELYEFYSILNKNNKQGIVSKRYFEKITREIINDHIDIDGLVLPSWWAQIE